MNKQQHDELFDLIVDAHWSLWRILSKVERGTHRMLVANADEALCEILREMKEAQPDGPRLVRGADR